MGGIVTTNDGNSILREVDVSHPAAKSMIELSRAQEEEVGDGTTSVIVLAGEYLSKAEPLLERQIHPTVICNGYLNALDDMGRKEIDIKRYAKVEKIPGGDMEDCRVLKGVMMNKDVVHPKMKRRIERPRILLLDCTLEYKKGESQTQIELSDEKAWEALLAEEENAIKEVCNEIT